MVQENEKMNKDNTHVIKNEWLKRRSVTQVSYDRRMPTNVKSKFYTTTIRLMMLYSSECWESQLGMLSPTLMDVRSYQAYIRLKITTLAKKVEVAHIEDKMQGRLRWFRQVQICPIDTPGSRCKSK